MMQASIDQLREHFKTRVTYDLEYRRTQLMGLWNLIEENSQLIFDALFNDLHKSQYEVKVTELLTVKQDISELINNLEKWTTGAKMARNMVFIADSGYTQLQPYGTVLIIGPFNFPVQLTLQPLAGALASGNCVVVKPSELCPHVEKLLCDLIPKYVDKNCVQVVTGGVKETTELLENRFDNIFYTGSARVGRIVMQAAAKHLTPVTLELGGKSPVYVDREADLTLTSKRLLWGKLVNLGQICVAPDYVLCHTSVKDELIAALKSRLLEFYGPNPEETPDLARIINNFHYKRLMNMLETTKGTIVHGGKGIEPIKFIEPTIVDNVESGDSLMETEIFGPILPIIAVQNVYEAIKFINEREKPLACYIFSKNYHIIEEFETNTTSGGFCSNECVYHTVAPGLPFGGVGESGMGSYHGRFSVEAFSHRRAVLHKETKLEMLNDRMRYPPWNKSKESTVEFMLKSKVKGKSYCAVM